MLSQEERLQQRTALAVAEAGEEGLVSLLSDGVDAVWPLFLSGKQLLQMLDAALPGESAGNVWPYSAVKC